MLMWVILIRVRTSDLRIAHHRVLECVSFTECNCASSSLNILPSENWQLRFLKFWTKLFQDSEMVVWKLTHANFLASTIPIKANDIFWRGHDGWEPPPAHRDGTHRLAGAFAAQRKRFAMVETQRGTVHTLSFPWRRWSTWQFFSRLHVLPWLLGSTHNVKGYRWCSTVPHAFAWN